MKQADFEFSAATAAAASAHYSDDERSVAADSWSVKSEYGSTLDGDEVRYAEAVDALAAAAAALSVRRRQRGASDYGSDGDGDGEREPEEEHEHEQEEDEAEPSALGLQSHWDHAYAAELANFHTHGDAGEIWFGEVVMDTVAAWTARVCAGVAAGLPLDGDGLALASREHPAAAAPELAGWSVLDIGTGNGLLLHALAKQGFADLTGTDYSDGAVELARAVADREGLENLTFLVDDVLESKLERQFRLVTDKGTLDAIGLHPDGRAHRGLYWKSVLRLLAPGGVLVVTSCNHTKDELVAEAEAASALASDDAASKDGHKDGEGPSLQYIDHIRNYPVFRFGGREGSRVATVAFLHKH